jgi:hypothetical protein
VWSFKEIECAEPERAARLKNSLPWEGIQGAVIDRFQAELRAQRIVVGVEQCESNRAWLRTILQFNVGSELQDLFFNSTCGYRGQFRRGWHEGDACNRSLVEKLRESYAALSPATVQCRLLSPRFEDLGAMKVMRETVLSSLAPSLSKIWACGLALDGYGSVRQVPLGVTTGRLVLEDGTTWNAISQEDPDALLEVKGAFLTESGPHQPKSPEKRSKALEQTGEPGAA